MSSLRRWVTAAEPTVRSAALRVAVAFAAATGLGLLRDLLVIRYLGYGQGSDAFFLGIVVPTLYLGIIGQGLFLPLAARNSAQGYRLIGWLTGAALILSEGVQFLSHAHLGLLTLAGVPLSILLLYLQIPRIRLAVSSGAIYRLSYAQLTTSLILLGVIAAAPREVPIYVSAYSLGLPCGLFIATIGLRKHPANDGLRSPPLPIPKKELAPYLASSVAVQAIPLVERLLAEGISAGLLTSLTLGAKLASLPIGIFGYASGTAIFGHIVRGGARETISKQISSYRGGKPAFYCCLALASLILFGLSLLLAPYLIELLRSGHRINRDDLWAVSTVIAIAPWAASQSLLTQESLARGHYSRYSQQAGAFIVAFGFIGGAAVMIHAGEILALSLPLSFAASTVVLMRD